MIFSEILPQTIVNRYPIIVGYYTIYVMWFYIVVVSPIAYPFGKVLKMILGEDTGNVMSKSHMKKLFESYSRQNILRSSESKILIAALDLKNRSVARAMTPLTQIFMLDINQNLDENLKKIIYQEGYSRIPIYEGNKENIVGILMARDLILTNIDNTLFTIKQLSSILVRDVIAID